MNDDRQLNEALRLDSLYKLNLLDTAPSESFDRITRMAARIFDLPIAAVSLTDSDRQWFKSRVGVAHTWIPRLRAPCAMVAESGGMVVVPDLLQHDFFRDSLLADNGVRFYAGAPLIASDGHCLGAMCVLGLAPRQASDDELASLADMAAMVMSQIELQNALGRIDPLSGLPNRNQFIEDFNDLQMHRPAGEQRLAVLINLTTPEQLSNAARVMNSSYLDEVVSEAVQWIRSEVGPRLTVYHVAAAQFVLIAPPEATLEPYLVLLREKIHLVTSTARTRFVATPSIGVAPFELGHADCLDVLRMGHSAAQDALDCASLVAAYSWAEDAAYQRRFTLLNEFGAALERQDQLRLVFQPRIDLASGCCIGAEALLRWRHPALGHVSPGEFIPVIERSAMARSTTAWVMEAALRQQAMWRKAGLLLQLSVNVSPANLLEPDFVERIALGLVRHGLPADCLELEITESAIMEHPKKAQATLDAIAATGIRLAIDDFGTGYSSLSYLQSMPADVVKIDQSFIRDLDHNERKRALVRTMITLSHDLGHRVVAEGIETAPVLSFLEQAGCDEAQGYLFARPLERIAFEDWCRDYARRPSPILN
ncbi:putative bifunctional diguanylate cyclase/phosphodiesterase [Janthinobacterium agaricidamnosum]|uniref:EAL domain protein n=1 Tax=Janthinobacterium agaricidamnosum NBRC 102515 = DSM 9628 TaxID=1349767 RepID=W0V563_9BURK|nr:GGDEF and EAL domain-containing protein [Janthinobacterium agaricidamnosum]CDG83011.1 EAL domain protein [Janthinobacterium agaricidamnosum NBRC 102515 = DSM 9628]